MKHLLVKSYLISTYGNPNHSSILKIKEIIGKKTLLFSFKFTDRKKIFNELQKVKSKKACQESDAPVITIKENINIITDFIYNDFNNLLFSSYFPSNLKHANFNTGFKKKDHENVENYRPASILPVLLKVYKSCMYDQMYIYLNKIRYFSSRIQHTALPSNHDRKMAPMFK